MHITLWHRNFWNIALSNLLLTTSVYLFLPVLPLQMSLKGYTALQITMCIAAYIAGLYVPGCRVNYFVEKYRRNHVCTYSILSLAVIFAFHYFFHIHSIVLTAVSCPRWFCEVRLLLIPVNRVTVQRETMPFPGLAACR